MSERRKRSLKILLLTMMVLAAMVVAGCREATDDEPTTSAAGSSDSAATDTVATDASGSGTDTTGDSAQKASGADSAGGLPAEERDDAVDLAQAYLVGLTDFRSDQFDWSLEAAAQDNEGGWWARVSATPKDNTALETIQIYMHKPVDFEMWVGHGMSPDIDPATDENMPEEVRSRL